MARMLGGDGFVAPQGRRFAKRTKYQPLLKGTARDSTRLIKTLKVDDTHAIDAFFMQASTSLRKELLSEPCVGRTYETLVVPQVALVTRSLSSEVRWTILSLLPYLSQLVLHIDLNAQWLRCVLLGDHDQAHEILERIERDLGVSVWMINARLLEAQRRDELTANRQVLGEICEKLKSASITMLAELASQRAESRIAYSTYLDDVERTLRPFGEYRNLASSVSWWRHWAAPFAPRRTDSDCEILWRNGLLPAIDRYVGLVRVLHSRVDERLFPTDFLPVMKHMARELQCVDPQLAHLLVAQDVNAEWPMYCSNHLNLSDLIDLYTEGAYSDVMTTATRQLLQYPEVFELYELVAASVTNGQLSIQLAFPDRALGNDVISAMIACMRREEGTRPLEVLQRIATQLHGTRFGAQLWGFIAGQPQGPNGRNDSALKGLACTQITPRFSLLYNQPEDVQRFWVHLEQAAGATTTARLYRAISTCDVSAIPRAIPASRRYKYAGQGFLAAGRYTEALQEYSQLSNAAGTVVPLFETAAVGIFSATVELGLYQLASETVVDAYRRNPTLIKAMNLILLAQRILDDAPPPSISWPIFWAIVDRDLETSGKLGAERDLKQITYDALEDFLGHHGMQFPSELLSKSAEFDQGHLVSLLSMVCTTDILDYSPDYNGADHLEQERIKLCEALLALDPSNASSYKAEIADLLRSTALRRTMKEIDSTKIHVDLQGLVDNLGQSYRERYDRYREYSALSEILRTSKLVFEIDKPFGNVANAILRGLKKSGSTTQYEDIAYRQAWDLFQDLLLRFISSEFGLDSYLSARIRHGVLAGQLRSAFEQHRLITQWSSHTTDYGPNVYWSDWVMSSYDDVVASKVDKHLKQLSKTVDAIIEHLKRGKIQIKSKVDGEGLFDFVYSIERDGNRIWNMVQTTTTYYEFIDVLIAELIARIGINLNSVAQYVRTDLAAEFRQALDAVSRSIASEHPSLTHSVLANSIRQCGTIIHNNLEIVAGWFVPKGGASALSIDIDVLCETVVETVKRMNPTYTVDATRSMPVGVALAGGMLSSVFDLLLILLDNAVKHCNSTQVEATVSAVVVGGILRLVVSNIFHGDPAFAEEAAQKLSNPAIRWLDPDALRQEGKSGFYKLHKILRYDLRQGSSYSVAAHVERHSEVHRFSVALEMNALAVLA